MERAVRFLWTWVVVKDPATLTATVPCVLPSAADMDTVRTTRTQEGGRLLLTCVLRRLNPPTKRPAVLQYLEVRLLQAVTKLSSRTTTGRLTAEWMTTVPTGKVF